MRRSRIRRRRGRELTSLAMMNKLKRMMCYQMKNPNKTPTPKRPPSDAPPCPPPPNKE
jgi:hypothetical protein